MASVKEESVAYITVTFYDKSNNLAAPTNIYYQVHDKGSATEMLARTQFLPPASSIELTMTSAINTLVSSRHREETRILTVEASGGGVDVNAEYEYDILNLEYIS